MMFEKVLIANRGEIALRVLRACRELGVRTVVVLLQRRRRLAAGTAGRRDRPDRTGGEPAELPQRGGDRRGGPADRRAGRPPRLRLPLRGRRLRRDLRRERARLRRAAAAGDVRAADKSTARALMSRAGLPLPPGSVRTLPTVAEAAGVAAEVGYPVIVKAAAGRRRARDDRGRAPPRALPGRTPRTRAAAQVAFGDDRVYVERYLTDARHVEVQVLCDAHGNGVHLGTRDCSVQRRHQKLVEEAPAPALSAATLDTIGARRRCAAPCRSASPARAPWSSSSTRRNAATSWRSTAGSRWSTRSPRWSPASTWCTSSCTSPPGCRCGCGRRRSGCTGWRWSAGSTRRTRTATSRPRPGGWTGSAARRPVHPGRHPRPPRLPGRPALRLAAGQGGGLGARPGAGPGPAGTRAGRVRHRRPGRADHHPVRPAGARRRRLPQGAPHHRPGRPAARRPRRGRRPVPAPDRPRRSTRRGPGRDPPGTSVRRNR